MDENPYKAPVDGAPNTRISASRPTPTGKTPLWLSFSGLTMLALATWFVGGYPSPVVAAFFASVALLSGVRAVIRNRSSR
jgi:hypothetical protein